jgi:hypothetical protein
MAPCGGNAAGSLFTWGVWPRQRTSGCGGSRRKRSSAVPILCRPPARLNSRGTGQKAVRIPARSSEYGYFLLAAPLRGYRCPPRLAYDGTRTRCRGLVCWKSGRPRMCSRLDRQGRIRTGLHAVIQMGGIGHIRRGQVVGARIRACKQVHVSRGLPHWRWI